MPLTSLGAYTYGTASHSLGVALRSGSGGLPLAAKGSRGLPILCHGPSMLPLCVTTDPRRVLHRFRRPGGPLSGLLALPLASLASFDFRPPKFPSTSVDVRRNEGGDGTVDQLLEGFFGLATTTATTTTGAATSARRAPALAASAPAPSLARGARAA